MAVMKDKSIEEATPVVELAPEPTVEPVVELAPEPVIVKEPVVVQAKKQEVVAVGGSADERVVVGGPLRGTNLASDGTAYLFTANGVCAIFKKHLVEFQARGCSEL